MTLTDRNRGVANPISPGVEVLFKEARQLRRWRPGTARVSRKVVVLLLSVSGVVVASCTSAAPSSSPPTTVAPPGGTRTTVTPTTGTATTKLILNDSGIGTGSSRTFSVANGQWNLHWNFDCSPGRGTGSAKIVRSGSPTTTAPVAVVQPQTDVSWGTTIQSSSDGRFRALTTLSRSCSWSVSVEVPT
jgi:hypothetical protein